MGNEALEASGRSEVTPASARDEGRRRQKCFLRQHGLVEERLGFSVWAAALLVCFLTWECLFSPVIRGNTLAP